MVDGVDVPVIASIFDSKRLDAVGDVELVAGGAGGDEGDRRAVDGDGVAGRKARLQTSWCRRRPTARSRRSSPPAATTWLLTTLPVAVPSVLKKLSPAATAEAATSDVSASVPIAEVSAD